VEQITHVGLNHLHIAVRGMKPGGRCPDCGRASRAVHSRYQRRPADLPALGRGVRIGLRVRRFYCRNVTCVRHTFAERLPELVKPHARRTDRLAEAQSQIGLALGGEAGAQLLSQLAMPVSADTVLRLVRDVSLPELEPPHAVVVDDWAEWPKVPRASRVEWPRRGCTRGVSMARSWWTSNDAAWWTCCRIARPRRWQTGCGGNRGSRSSPATAQPSTPAAPPWASLRWPSIGCADGTFLASSAQRRASLRPLAPAGQHAPSSGALAARCPCPAPALAVAAR